MFSLMGRSGNCREVVVYGIREIGFLLRGPYMYVCVHGRYCEVVVSDVGVAGVRLNLKGAGDQNSRKR